MGRRASSSLNATAIIGIVVVLAILIAAGAFFLRGKKNTFSSPPLPASNFVKNANSYRGSEFQVQGKVFRSDPRDSGFGVSILVEEAGQEIPIFLIVPAELKDSRRINIDRDVNYVFQVMIQKGGVPVATDYKRL